MAHSIVGTRMGHWSGWSTYGVTDVNLWGSLMSLYGYRVSAYGATRTQQEAAAALCDAPYGDFPLYCSQGVANSQLLISRHSMYLKDELIRSV